MKELTVKEFLDYAIEEDFIDVDLYDVDKEDYVFSGTAREAMNSVFKDYVIDSFGLSSRGDIELNISTK